VTTLPAETVESGKHGYMLWQIKICSIVYLSWRRFFFGYPLSLLVNSYELRNMFDVQCS